ncbi:uncharacterized protein BDZ99DRAFT_433163 [Mytilinidion resinicola]|uniref:Uncharacterized protein n=1 Tax=Mytilinidion resinicola TaxID=574789 RepID=A0A6A6Z7G5_9PEZI|nr:uncharacterized protein BDZ99DRAFT_433163 [Mytilinidion resinicola]KAF2816177.1 hypothetical protein BDZ99DRAFT_433163 [Mytilinidion resinicola]
MTSWKIIPDPSDIQVQYTSFLNSRSFFAVDASGSAGFNSNSVLNSERVFVESVPVNQEARVAKWGQECDAPRRLSTIKWKADHGGTTPSSILNKKEALECIQKSDCWFLLTDGQVFGSDVNQLAELAMEHDVLSIPVVFLITGSRGSTPETTDISVGISFFANSHDTLILFKEVETGRIYIIAAKGCFSVLNTRASARNLSSWDEITKFKNEREFFQHCKSLDISVPKYEYRRNLPKGVSLGPEWEKVHHGPVYVDLDQLVKAAALPDDELFPLLAEEAFNNLCIAFKIRRRIAELRPFIAKHKSQQVTPQLEDVAGAAKIISGMGEEGITLSQKKDLQERLREAHAKNREHYQERIATFSSSPEVQVVRKRNQLVDAALRQLTEIEYSGFTAEILARSSNRARRAAVVSSDSTLALANLNFDVPSYKGYCLVCCGDEEVMSISLKFLEQEETAANTADFALNFPLAAGRSSRNLEVVSSQNVCFQCALLGPSGLSIYKERLSGILPCLAYEGSNKKYINQQLYLTLTGGLQTGASGLSQLFMTILEQTVKTKSWAGSMLQNGDASADEQNEAVQRRSTFLWMLANMLKSTRCRQTFSEVGEWVTFSEALIWAAEDFEQNGVASFVITYPMKGFMQLLSFGSKSGAFSEVLIRTMKISKVLHSVTTLFLGQLLKDRSGDALWRHNFSGLIYREFNAPLIPKDLGGPKSLIREPERFWMQLSACLSQEVELLDAWVPEDQLKVMGRVQILVFWLLSYQKARTSAQNFFKNIRHNHPIATAVLDPQVALPTTVVASILLTPFLSEDHQDINPELAAIHSGLPPFSTPFGPSVLHCGFERCPASFIPSTPIEVNLRSLQQIRDARAEHFVQVFGIRGRFEDNMTGLPSVTSNTGPPSSRHVNLHSGLVRTWASLATGERRAIAAGPGEAFDAFVEKSRRQICETWRGDIFSSGIQHAVRAIIPSFFEALREALRREGAEDCEDVAAYEHDFDKNRMEFKVKYELAA